MNELSRSAFASPVSRDVVPTGCCPPFDPQPFQDKELTWTDELFVRERVHSLFHVPIDMQRKVAKAMHLVEASHAAASPRGLMLGDEISPWKSDLYIHVTGPVAGAHTTKLSGTFLTHVYEGPFRDARSWCEDMKRRVTAKGRKLRKIYFGYTTCPACAKAYGKNYVVLLAEVEPREATSRYDVHVKQSPPGIIVTERRHTEWPELGSAMQATLAKIANAVMPAGAARGAPFAIFHNTPFHPDDIDVEMGLSVPPTAKVTEANGLHRHDASGGPVAYTTHVGPYQSIGDAYAALYAWIEGHGHRRTGPPREIYLVGPAQTESPAEYRTEIDVPID